LFIPSPETHLDRRYTLLTASQMASEIAYRVGNGITTSDVKEVLSKWEEIVLEEIQDVEKVKLGQLVQLQVKIRPARKKRMGRNPRTGEDVQIAAKPASTVVRARVLKKVKDATPSVKKAKKAGV
jgi:nucleoid DNA-binding protein